MDYIAEIFSYPFAVRAIIVGSLVSLCAALLGINLVLKRFSMLGDGLSHVSFGAAAIALAAGVAPLKLSIPIVIIAAFLLLRLGRKANGDAAIAMVSSSALAIGIIVATMTTGMNTDINNYMFGSVLAMSKGDVYIAVAVAVCVIILFILFYEKLFCISFDEEFSRAIGVKVGFYNTLNAILTAVTIVVAMRIMGALLISSIIIFPPMSAMKLCKKYRLVVILSACVSIFAFLMGIFLSFFYDMPVAAAVVATKHIIFIVFSIISKIKYK
ncbi:MAG: metal ABC transporter permease [Clostridia bacterium]|nr:metal ABC transporter permease [Clostridia bacterium]